MGAGLFLLPFRAAECSACRLSKYSVAAGGRSPAIISSASAASANLVRVQIRIRLGRLYFFDRMFPDAHYALDCHVENNRTLIQKLLDIQVCVFFLSF